MISNYIVIYILGVIDLSIIFIVFKNNKTLLIFDDPELNIETSRIGTVIFWPFFLPVFIVMGIFYFLGNLFKPD
jgi:hypothetical protein